MLIDINQLEAALNESYEKSFYVLSETHSACSSSINNIKSLHVTELLSLGHHLCLLSSFQFITKFSLARVVATLNVIRLPTSSTSSL